MRIFFHANLARLRPIQLLSKMEKWDLRTELDWNSKFDFTLIRISFLYKTTKRLFCSYETFSIWLRSPLQYFKSYFFFFFFNAELPQDPKSRSSQSIQTAESGSDESLNTSSSDTVTSGNLTKDQSSLSHPDLSEIHKTRAATLPARGFRTGKYSQLLSYDTVVVT